MKHKAERMQILRQTPLGPLKYSLPIASPPTEVFLYIYAGI